MTRLQPFRRLSLVVFAVVMMPLPSTLAQPPNCSIDPRCSFVVSFSGIVCHARWKNTSSTNSPNCKGEPGLRRRAIIVEGGFITMRHHPTLFLPTSLKGSKAVLESLSGHSVTCDVNNCAVEIDGLDMRIRTDGNPPLDKLIVDDTFCDLVPHLKDDKDFKGGDLDPAYLSNDLPSRDAAGYFEIEGGDSLEACLFRQGGIFVAPDGTVLSHTCRRFADEVWWRGTTEGVATLEVRSRHTPGKDWTPVPINNSGQLWLRVETVSSAHRTPEHFALHQKLLTGVTLPTILPCDPTDTGGRCVDAEIDVPGCGDTNWP
jgi:hypothetical protein